MEHTAVALLPPSTAVGWSPQNGNPCSREEQSLQRAEQPMVGFLLNLQMETSKKFVTWYYVNAFQDTQRLVYFQLIPTPFYSHRNYYCSQRKKKLARTILMGLFSKGDPFFHCGGKETNIILSFRRSTKTALDLDERYLSSVLHCLPNSGASCCIAKIYAAACGTRLHPNDHRSRRLPIYLLLDIECRISASSFKKSSGHRS